ncbi:Ger(x)C family spore germination protein (plasmid) [Pseudalkalibacillus hwajinpoensis]|uniref:Ger(x)C family spore germination protein n=1 Tax=Guptibacillus hwajinpoensis TaxID=208199 RepID=UPI00325B6985
MRLSHISKWSVFVLSLLFLTSCWSMKEIEDLGLVLGVAIDLEEEGLEENLITLTNQLAKSNSSEAGKEGGASSFKNVSETGHSLMGLTLDSLLKNKEIPLAHHIKVIVIGEDLARTTNLQQILDYFLREHEIRPSCLILIAKNRASQILETSDPSVVPSLKLAQMTTNTHKRNSKVLPPVSLLKLSREIQSESSFLLQNVISTNGEVTLEGASVFEGKTKKLKGFLTKEEVMGINWIKGNVKGGYVEIFVEKQSNPIVFEVLSMKTHIQPHVNGNNISFEVDIESEGRIGEDRGISMKPFSDDTLARAEKAIEKEVKRLVESVSEKTQEELQADVFGYRDSLRIHYPKVWKKVKKDWDQTFSEVPIEYNVKITIKDFGTIGK